MSKSSFTGVRRQAFEAAKSKLDRTSKFYAQDLADLQTAYAKKSETECRKSLARLSTVVSQTEIERNCQLGDMFLNETQTLPRVSFTGDWSKDLGKAIKLRSVAPYRITFGIDSEAYEVFASAVNVGIDSRLEAVIVKKIAGGYEVAAKSVHTLVRRLLEADDKFIVAYVLASGICETLGIELV